MSRGRTIGLAALGALAGLFAIAEAQPVVVVPYDTARLAWDYAPAEEARITGFRVDCQAGPTTLSVSVPKTDRSVLVQAVVPGPGDYSCVVVAVSGSIASAPSNPVLFGVQPVAASNFRVESP